MRVWLGHRGGKSGAVLRRTSAVVGVVLSMVPCGVEAESDRVSAQQFFYQEGLRANQPASATRTGPPRTPSTFRRILMQRAVGEPRQGGDRRAARPSAATTRTIAVYGDRFGQAVAAGLADASGPETAVLPLTSDDAGLTRPDFADWLQVVRTRIAKPDHPTLAVIMMGSNDRQPLDDGGHAVATTDPRWNALYAARVDALAKTFADAHVPLIWVGLPSVRSEESSAEFVQLNGIVRDRVARAGATYIDSWEAFADDTGRYSPVGPDLEGDTVKLRKADGFGFTRAGARKLASFLENDLKRLQSGAKRPATADDTITIETNHEFDQALEIDVNAQIRREAGLSPDGGSATAPATPEALQKPVVGPPIPLTAPLSPGGRLVAVSARAEARAPAPDVGTEAPKPGRADDFSWPKP